MTEVCILILGIIGGIFIGMLLGPGVRPPEPPKKKKAVRGVDKKKLLYLHDRYKEAKKKGDK
jgi:hypothetical protein